MSCHWHVHCLDCHETSTFDDANHRDDLMMVLCKYAYLIAALKPLIDDDASKWASLELRTQSYGMVDIDWFVKHVNHRLSPINEYGYLLGDNTNKCVCND